MTALDNFRREAKRWLKALRAGDADAHRRLHRAHSDAPVRPMLRDVQHALAREHGYDSWPSMRTALDRGSSPAVGTDASQRGQAEWVAVFLEAACPDANVRGPNSRMMDVNTAMRVLTRHPDIARDNLYTCVVCGEIEEVRRILDVRPEDASESGGPRQWPPLLYLCNASLPVAAAAENAVAIAQALLDGGADPNARYMLHGIDDYPYSALAGVLGRGEEEARTHPKAEALARLLFEQGAEPYDGQLLYNVFADHGSRRELGDDIVWLLDLIYTYAIRRGRAADWSNPDWPMLDPWGRGWGAGYLLEAAIDRNHLTLAQWLLAHGAGPDATRILPSGQTTRTPYEQALRKGFTDMAALLVRYGATPRAVSAGPRDTDEDAFVAACLRLDRDNVTARLAAHPEYLKSAKAMFAAAQDDRADVVAFLLDLGVSPDVEDPELGRARTLHQAAGADAGRVVSLLIERGADVDARESNWGATPLGFAVYGRRQRALDALSRVSRDVFNLTFTGNVDRLRELLNTEPDLAKLATKNGMTPLMRLPDDEAAAVEIIDLLVAHGADPAARTAEGETAVAAALERGLETAAERLRTS